MAEESNISALIKGMAPSLNKGEFVFCTLQDSTGLNWRDTICTFKESEGLSIVIDRQKADGLGIDYDFIASWITLTIHSSLNAIGFTALISSELAKHDVGCNIIAGYHHDHIFVNRKDTNKAMEVLSNLSKK